MQKILGILGLFLAAGAALKQNGIVPARFEQLNPLFRIIQGKPAEENQFPWQVYMQPRRGKEIGHCGGSIISENWVLTAGHCTYEMDKIVLFFGSTKLDSMPVEMTATKWEQHPRYDPDSLNNDVSLIRLPTPLAFTDGIRPIRLMSHTEAALNLYGRTAITSGFGYTTDKSPSVSKSLMYTTVRIITNSECVPYYGDIIVADCTLCTRGAPDPMSSTCSGDSGGPLIMEDGNGQFTQIGVNSFVSEKGCLSMQPAGYARLSFFLDWIQDKTAIEIPH